MHLITSCLPQVILMTKTQLHLPEIGQASMHPKECQSVASVWEAATQRQGKLSEIKNTAKSVISQFKDLTLKIAWAWLQSIAASIWMKAATNNKTIINIKSHQECWATLACPWLRETETWTWRMKKRASIKTSSNLEETQIINQDF